MAKVTLSSVTNLKNQAQASNTLNNNFAAIADEFENTLSRDGTQPNEMNANFDMNGYKILNVGTPSDPTDLVRLQDVPQLGDVSSILDQAEEWRDESETFAETALQAALDSGQSASSSAIAYNAIAGGTNAIVQVYLLGSTDVDPGSGYFSFDQIPQNAASTVRMSVFHSDLTNWTSVLDTWDDSTSPMKGYIRAFKRSDPTKWLMFTLTSITPKTNYRNMVVNCIASSSSNPFAAGDLIVFSFARTGDVGASGGGSGDVVASNNGSEFTNKATLRTNIGLQIGSDVQAYDADLAALATNTTNGLWTRTGSGTGTTRVIAAGAGIQVTNPDGLAGNPTIAQDINGLSEVTPDANNDYVPIYDTSSSGVRKVKVSSLTGVAGIAAANNQEMKDATRTDAAVTPGNIGYSPFTPDYIGEFDQNGMQLFRCYNGLTLNRTNTSGGVFTLQLPVNYADSAFSVQCSAIYSGNGYATVHVTNKTVNSISFATYVNGSLNNSVRVAFTVWSLGTNT